MVKTLIGNDLVTIQPSNVLPPEYQEVKYIQSSGTQYIDTGILSDVTKTCEMVTCVMNLDAHRKVFCQSYSGANATSMGIEFGGTENSKPQTLRGWVQLGSGTDFFSTDTIPLNTKVDVDWTWDPSIRTQSMVYTYNGTTRNMSATQPGNIQNINAKNFRLFLDNRPDTSAIAYPLVMYFFKLYVDGTLVRNFIPCYRKSDSVIGMYDTITETFFTNGGTGTFTKGNDVNRDPLNCYIGDVTQNYTQLEYLQSTGTQYIDMGIKGKSGIDFDCKVNFTSLSNAAAVGGEYNNSTGDGSLYLGLVRTNGKLAYHYGTYTTNPVEIASITANTDYTIVGHMWNGSQYVTVNGTKYTVGTYSGTFTSSYNMYLFTNNYLNAISAPASAKIYYCKIYDNGTLVRDFIPALDYKGIPCMFDRVTKTPFYNQGSGEFLYKELDHTVLDYIESSGTQYIDTGYIADSNTTAKVRFCVTAKGDKNFIPTIQGGELYNSADNFGWCMQYTPGGTTHQTLLGYRGSMFNVHLASNTARLGDTITATLAPKLFTQVNETLGTTGTIDLSSSTITKGTRTLYLFRGNSNTTDLQGPGTQKIYYAKLWDGDYLVRDFVPVLKDGVYCMFDTCTNSYFYNKGTGNFTGGYVINGTAYRPVNYLQGQGAQYIDTGYKTQDKLTFETEFNGTTTQVLLFGGRTFPTDINGIIWGYTNGSTAYNLYGSTNGPTAVTVNVLDGNYHTLTFSDEAYVIDSSIQKTRNAVAPITASSNIYLFTWNNNGQGGADSRMWKGNIKYFRIYKNNSLVMNLVPVVNNTTSVPCMMDKVTRTIFENKGSGTFLYG